MKKMQMKRTLLKATGGCNIQHTGYPCGTCFFAMSDELTNEDWQALLYFRGDYKKKDLSNLPDDIDGAIQKIYDIAVSRA